MTGTWSQTAISGAKGRHYSTVCACPCEGTCVPSRTFSGLPFSAGVNLQTRTVRSRLAVTMVVSSISLQHVTVSVCTRITLVLQNCCCTAGTQGAHEDQ
jgi:hypothetical protein